MDVKCAWWGMVRRLAPRSVITSSKSKFKVELELELDYKLAEYDVGVELIRASLANLDRRGIM